MQERVCNDFSPISWHCDIMKHHLWARCQSLVKDLSPENASSTIYTCDSFKHYSQYNYTIVYIVIPLVLIFNNNKSCE